LDKNKNIGPFNFLKLKFVGGTEIAQSGGEILLEVSAIILRDIL